MVCWNTNRCSSFNYAAHASSRNKINSCQRKGAWATWSVGHPRVFSAWWKRGRKPIARNKPNRTGCETTEIPFWTSVCLGKEVGGSYQRRKHKPLSIHCWFNEMRGCWFSYVRIHSCCKWKFWGQHSRSQLCACWVCLPLGLTGLLLIYGMFPAFPEVLHSPGGYWRNEKCKLFSTRE